MRTVKRESSPLNTLKKSTLEDMCLAYFQEKKYWLDTFRDNTLQSELNSPRKIRDDAVKNKYKSKCGLQARAWKLALQDSIETWDKYWQSLFVEARKKIARHLKEENERHYAYWLLKGYKQFSACRKGDVEKPPFELAFEKRKKISGYVQRITKRLQGQPPTVKKNKTIKFDADCYEVFEHKEKQYIKLMSLQRGKRIVLPLLGKSKIEGNVILVLKKDHAEIHVSQELKKKAVPKNTVQEAVDFGYTEAMTDSEGLRYGTGLGKVLTSASDQLHKKMKKRHQLHAFEKKQRSLNPKKSKRLQRYNLGKEKLDRRMDKVKAAIAKEVNTGINQLIKTKRPSLLITEDLSAPFTYKKPKSVNRKLSYWVRGELQKRVAFKALAEGFRHEQVNPAYGSQTCFLCGFVDSRNRKGDKFKCLYCRHENVADRVAAMNYNKRYEDEEIRCHTPWRQVKIILLKRFHRRLETEKSVTVPGWTLETAQEGHPLPLSEILSAVGRE